MGLQWSEQYAVHCAPGLPPSLAITVSDISLFQAYNASEEEARADSYPNIRLFTAALMASDTPQQELLAVEQPWSVASSS